MNVDLTPIVEAIDSLGITIGLCTVCICVWVMIHAALTGRKS